MGNYDEQNCTLNEEDTNKFFGGDFLFLIAIKKEKGNYNCVRIYPNGLEPMPESDNETAFEEANCILEITIKVPKEENFISVPNGPFERVSSPVSPRAFCRCGPPGNKGPC